MGRNEMERDGMGWSEMKRDDKLDWRGLYL